MTVRVLDEFCLQPAAPLPRDVAVNACLVGAGLSGGFLAALAHNWTLDIVDRDFATPLQRMVPSLTEAMGAKAALAQAYRRDRFPWLSEGLAVVGEVQALGGGYWRHLAMCGGIILALTDCTSTQAWLGATARRYGLHYLAAGLNEDSVQVFIAPADPATGSYCCRRIPTQNPTRGCLEPRLPDARPVNPADPPSTNSAPYLGAAAASLVYAEAAALVLGQRPRSETVTMSPGRPVSRDPVPRDPHCPICSQVRRLEGEIVPVGRGYRDHFEDIFSELGGLDGWEVAVPPATDELACSDCGWAANLKDFVLVDRHLKCPRPLCKGGRLVCGDRTSGSGWVPVTDIATRTPRALGWPYWAILEARRGPQRSLIELAGDAIYEGLLELKPLYVEVT